jgi:uncharacterized membrane protein YgcG
MKKPLLLLGIATAACFAIAVAKADAQTTTPPSAQKMDARFNAWLGCWRLEDDIAGTGARMCITPDRAGVRLQTLVGTQRGIDELVIADGAPRAIVDTECKGTEVAEWSNDGTRVFRTTEVTCNNEGKRIIKSVAFLAPGPMWINVQHVSGEAAAANVRAQRYRRAANQTLADGSKAAQPAAAVPLGDTRWSIEDVIEASSKLPAEALQAALTDVKQKFNISKTTLLALDDADVPDSVIDLMVALTFPDRFIVERAAGSSMPVGVSTGGGWYDPFMSPMWSGQYANCYSAGGYYGYRSYYNACGPYYYGYNTFSPYGSYSPYYSNYYPGGWVPVGNVVDVTTPSGEGRVVNGRGYTQIRERSPEPAPSRVNSGGNGTASGWSGNSGGGASSGGYSSGSSGSSSGGSSSGGGERTAVARPPGN